MTGKEYENGRAIAPDIANSPVIQIRGVGPGHAEIAGTVREMAAKT
jgi:hypothetical protein